MNARDWLAAYADKLGVPPPTKDELKAVLDLAGEAAHSSERIAAPVKRVKSLGMLLLCLDVHRAFLGKHPERCCGRVRPQGFRGIGQHSPDAFNAS